MQESRHVQKTCGDDALRNVVLGTTKWGYGTTKWGYANAKADQRRETQLQDTYWKEMVQHGSVIMQVHSDSSSTWDIINHILCNEEINFVLTQAEILDLQKAIPDTEAGKMLRYTFQELLEQQKNIAHKLERGNTTKKGDTLVQEELLENRQRMDETIGQIHELKVPLGVRIKRFFRL